MRGRWSLCASALCAVSTATLTAYGFPPEDARRRPDAVRPFMVPGDRALNRRHSLTPAFRRKAAGPTYRAALRDAIDVAGIEPRWDDMGHKRHVVGPNEAVPVLHAMGAPVESAARLRAWANAQRDRLWRVPVAPAIIGDVGQRLRVSLRLPASHLEDGKLGKTPIRFRIARDGNSEPVSEGSLKWLRRGDERVVDGERLVEVRGTLSVADLPAGKYSLTLITPDASGLRELATRLALAPPRAYVPPGRHWLVHVNPFTLRSEGDWGGGTWAGLAKLAPVVKHIGASGASLLPVWTRVIWSRDDASPYRVDNLLYFDPLLIDVPEAAAYLGDGETLAAINAPSFQRELAEARARPLVDARALWARMRPKLAMLFEHFEPRAAKGGIPGNAAVREYLAFRERGDQLLRRTASVLAVGERFGGPDQWPEQIRPRAGKADPAAVRTFIDADPDLRGRRAFFEFVLWLSRHQGVEAQRAFAREGLPMGLKHDVPAGPAGDGSQALDPLSAVIALLDRGCPWDYFTDQGQAWGSAPEDPIEMQLSGYRELDDELEALTGGAGRFDHAPRFRRQYVVAPNVHAGVDGVYLRYPLQEILRLLTLHSAARQQMIEGETLGTVQKGYREALTARGVLSVNVLPWARDWDRPTQGSPFFDPAEFPELHVLYQSNSDTGDLWTWWAGGLIGERRRRGVYRGTAKQARDAEAQDWKEWIEWRQALTAKLDDLGLLERFGAQDVRRRTSRGAVRPLPIEASAALRRAITHYLGSTRAKVVVVPLPDLLGESLIDNVPSTLYPANWTLRPRVPVERLPTHPTLLETAAWMMEGRAEGPGPPRVQRKRDPATERRRPGSKSKRRVVREAESTVATGGRDKASAAR